MKTDSFMTKLATFIVKKKYIFLAFFAVLCIFSAFSSSWVEVCDDLAAYLPDTTETRKGLDIMEEEFTTYATARVMFANVTLEEAAELLPEVAAVPGVKSVEFDASEDHFKDAAALFDVTFTAGELDEESIESLDALKETFASYDLYVSSEIGNPTAQILDREMNLVLILCVIIICAVLLFTSRTWAEVPILLMTFGAAALLNKGSNFIFGEISFITDSIAVVLQLGLAIDYAIILCHRYTEERENCGSEEACIRALSKAIPEISASSLTTISGLLALAFMNFQIGADMSRVLIKAILLSLLSVFLLMPALLVIASPLIDKTHHRSLVPSIHRLGKLVAKTRYVVPPVFLVVLVASFILSGKCPYVYGYSNLDTLRQNEVKIAEKQINEIFPKKNLLAILVPSGDYDSEKALIRDLEALPGVDSCTGLAGVAVNDEYTVTSALTPREFSALADVDIESARLLYSAYCLDNSNYGQLISNLDQCRIPLIDVLKFLRTTIDDGYVTLSSDQTETVNDLYEQLIDGERQLSGPNYSRIITYLNLPEESEETYTYLGTIRNTVGKYYTEHYLVGETVNCLDLQTSFERDNIVISVLSILFVILVLILTFKSVGLPLLLILVIQGSIYLNFSFPFIQGKYMFFLAYLIVSSIQMGANIDYAIVISSRYMELKKEIPYKRAMGEALDQAFPTILTSGNILFAAGFAIGYISSENTVSMIGMCLGRGTLISIVFVFFALPQILLLGDTIISKTQFSLHAKGVRQQLKGAMTVDGRVRGYISGYVDAEIHGLVTGDFNATVSHGEVKAKEDEND